MDSNALPRKRTLASSPVRPPIRISRDKKAVPDRQRSQQLGRIRRAKDSSEFIRVPRRETGSTGGEEDATPRHFTVANVGAGGTLYLKPSRAPVNIPQLPATPPRTSDGAKTGSGAWANNGRSSNTSGTRTPRPHISRGHSFDPSVPMPPVSINNANQRRRPRSHSFSTTSERRRSTLMDTSDVQILVNGQEARPKTSMDSTNLLDFQIPHYQLGTPRFSEYGTAYLHNSIYASSEDGRSSEFLGNEYDKLFPVPPTRLHGPPGAGSRNSALYLHPSMGPFPISMPRSSTSTISSSMPAASKMAILYDRIEKNPNDPSCVRYDPETGRISAATGSRLIVQITSPLFLDYELLSDFFLTFRNFLTPSELLEYLMARMRWALESITDARRIVRVRTFVALRHWILNYFADDFVPDHDFRQRFCDLVNDLTKHLQSKPDRGGSELNIIGELKKCWRRTCAVFWSEPTGLEKSVEADLLPGGEPGPAEPTTPTQDSPQLHVYEPSPPEVERPSYQVAWSHNPETGVPRAELKSRRDTGALTMRTASIPTSPISEQSLQVLSCSVPFLRNMGNLGTSAKAAEKMMMVKSAPPQRKASSRLKPASHQHKRSGSFSDALRDKRSPLPSAKSNNLDIRSLPTVAFTGGLVRGLLLQPSPAELEIPVTLSPIMSRNMTPDSTESSLGARNAQQTGVKRIVADVRRALSGRRPHPSPNLSQKSANDSKLQTPSPIPLTKGSNIKRLPSAQRIDILGARIQASYKNVFEQPAPGTAITEKQDIEKEEDTKPIQDDQQSASEALGELPPFDPRPFKSRMNSNLTTGSQSILIVDDTGMANFAAPAPPIDGNQEFIFDAADLVRGDSLQAEYAIRALPDVPGQEQEKDAWRRSSSKPMHELLSYPQSWTNDGTVSNGSERLTFPTPPKARKSSTAHPEGLDISPVKNQLRRRPGGDLKAADHVHELEANNSRPQTAGSFSTISQSARTSGVATNDLSGTHFAPQDSDSWPLPSGRIKSSNRDSLRRDMHQSQPNMRSSYESKGPTPAVPAISEQNGQNGGIEETLMRLEGKTSSSTSRTSVDPSVAGDADLPSVLRQPPSQGPTSVPGTAVPISRPESAKKNESQPLLGANSEAQGPSIVVQPAPDSREGYVRLESASPDARDSIVPPVLPRGSKITQFPIQDSGMKTPSRSASPTKSAVASPETKVDKFVKFSTPAKSSPSQGSFLLDDNESLSDISTEIADQEDYGLGMQSFFFDDNPEEEAARLHRSQIPLTPPSTISPPPDRSPENLVVPKRGPLNSYPLKEASSAPRLMANNQPLSGPEDYLRRVRTAPSPPTTAHLPFVLAFDAETIAEQFTIIEKDALDEVDWKDLIGMRWQQTPTAVRNWVDYLQNENCNGIDIVIARFNLVVKWVISECMLTGSLNERVRCITKFIHIASWCHRLRNYASMYQITLALLSSDLARLHKTWANVGAPEKETLDRLEKLCQPLHNFHNLRAEMESSTLDAGCIPFIGLYTRDLSACLGTNKSPALLEPIPPSKEPLINFERYQTSATIVKSLLRLIEASSKYVFRPHPDALSRCLWLAALDDQEISSISKTIEG